jgi:hypothetical protein
MCVTTSFSPFQCVQLPNQYAKLLPLSMCINLRVLLFSSFDRNDKESLWIFSPPSLFMHKKPSLNKIPSRSIENFNCAHLRKRKLLPDTTTNEAFFEVVNCVLYRRREFEITPNFYLRYSKGSLGNGLVKISEIFSLEGTYSNVTT